MRIGVDIHCGVRAEKFLTQDERVTGIVASSPDGSVEIIARATVLTSGGNAANADLKAKYVEVGRINVINPNATGDGHVMAFRWARTKPAPSPKETMDRRLPCSRIITKIMKVGLG